MFFILLYKRKGGKNGHLYFGTCNGNVGFVHDDSNRNGRNNVFRENFLSKPVNLPDIFIITILIHRAGNVYALFLCWSPDL